MGELREIVNMGELCEIWNLGEPGGGCPGELLRAYHVKPPSTLSKNSFKLRLVREQMHRAKSNFESASSHLAIVGYHNIESGAFFYIWESCGN